MVCGKYFLDVHWPTCDKQLKQSSKRLISRSLGDSTLVSEINKRKASEEIELKCHALFEADSTVQPLLGTRLKRYEFKMDETGSSGHKSHISIAPMMLKNRMLTEEAAAHSDESNMLISITSAVEIGQDALSLIMFRNSKDHQQQQSLNNRFTIDTRPADGNIGQASAIENGNGSGSGNKDEDGDESHEDDNGEFRSMLELSLVSEPTTVYEDDIDVMNAKSSLPKWPIKGQTDEELSISSLEVNLSTLRAEFGDILSETILDNNKSHVNITTSEIVICSSKSSSLPRCSGKNSTGELERLEIGAEREENSNIGSSLEEYNRECNKLTQGSSCKHEARESPKNRSLKATFTRSGRHFGHWLMATCSWKQTARVLPNLRLKQRHGDHKATFMIMISYCHKEAQQYALSLKKSLEEIGLSVYLDVDEICTGCDWQDSLNEAIYNCHAFVALVTPSYGETLWTRREFKLADALNKHIIPINFCTSWPPAKLAIQFATVQYISWLDKSFVYCNNNSGEEEEERGEKDGDSDYQFEYDFSREEVQSVAIPYWPRTCVKRIARQIELSIRQRLGYLSELAIQEEECPLASSSSGDSMFNSSSYSPEVSTQHDNNDNNSNQFRWFRRENKDGYDVETSGEDGETEYFGNMREGMWKNTPSRLELTEQEEDGKFRQKQMQISCRSFSSLPRATDQIETPAPTRQLPDKVVERETAATLTVTKKKSLRFRAVKTFNKVRRRFNGHQQETRG